MFEKEERELERSKDIYNHVTFSEDRADAAILEGIQRAKKEKLKGRKRRPVKILLAASVFIFSFITTVNMSDAAADYMRNIPGMSEIIDFVRNDKGLLAAIENDYVQKIDNSATLGDIEITLDSIIHDEKNLILFYKYEAEDEYAHVMPEPFKLLNSNGDIINNDVFGQYYSETKNELLKIRVPLTDGQKLPKNLILSGQFNVDGQVLESKWEIPFQLDEDKFAKKHRFNLNKIVDVEKQKITIKEVTVYPSQTDVHILFDPDNSKQIFGINDFQIVDEKGEVWDAISPSTTIVNEDEIILHLQSHFFSNPKELNLRFSSVRALDKEELWVEIDPSNKKILKAPKDGKLTEVNLWNEELFIKLEASLTFAQNQIFRHAIDQEGKIIGENQSFGAGWSPGDNYIQYMVPYPNSTAPGPIKLKLYDYPTTIQKEVIVPIK